MESKKKIFLISLGCAKNLVDSENVLGHLKTNGFPIVSRLEEAEVAIVNTCGFIQSAVEESIDTILEVAKRKERAELEALYVIGCFVQRYGYKLRKEIPEVDGWLGTGEIHKIVDILEGGAKKSPSFLISTPTYLADHTVPRVQTTPFYSAYLKIAEGCSHKCSYCTIPRLRGPYRSRGLESLIMEAENMVGRGVKEVNLIAQDTTMYGRDLEGDIHLEDLLERLVHVQGLRWVRILYGHPHGISDRLLELVDGEEMICPYLDIPLQHINEKILEAMGRGCDGENPWQLIERIRARTPQVSLRTTVMVGFPGETDEIFDELYGFVRAAEFDHLGGFIYSPEEGTSAPRLEPVVEERVAKERLDAIMGLQAQISERKNREMVGHIVSVLVEGVSPETHLLLKGRTATMAPDVDGQVLINKGEGVIGEIVPVRIEEAHTYDLVGPIL
ncbi:MAG: 30S ribosomal protein S12 methylthiotransferase RimO [Desulfobacteraceae bacterium]|nr:30S ribosomal protein S12 methylthiotransferase RimO [Desulfobacteraceae bacterium]